jgi:hypothetical protein
MTSLLAQFKSSFLYGKTLICLVKAALGDNIMFMAFCFSLGPPKQIMLKKKNSYFW